jgi:hypothetical protein
MNKGWSWPSRNCQMGEISKQLPTMKEGVGCHRDTQSRDQRTCGCVRAEVGDF